MPLRFASLVKETSLSIGTGTLDLVAATGFRTFVNALDDGDRVKYQLEKGNQREVGLGTFKAATPNQLQRDAVEWSTEADPKTKIPFDGEGGPIIVRLVRLADGETEIYLGNFVASGVSSWALQNVLTPLFPSYRIRINAFTVDTSADGPRVRVQVAGVTKSGASDYKYQLITRDSLGNELARNSNATSIIAMASAAGMDLGLEDAWVGEMKIENLGAGRRTRIRFAGTYSESTGEFAHTVGSGMYVTIADVVDGLEFFPIAGTFDIDLDVFGEIGGGVA